MSALIASVRQHDVVEGFECYLHVANIGFGVDRNEGGGDTLARFEIEEIASEMAVDMRLGADIDIV